MSNAVFWLEAFQEIPEGLHGLCEVDSSTPDGTNFIRLIRWGCWSRQMWGRGERDFEAQPIRVEIVGITIASPSSLSSAGRD
jgi:hypothetical protein